MSYLIFEDSLRVDLLPITFSRPAFMIRMGIFTSKERWEKVLGSSCYPLAYSYLQSLYTATFKADTYTCINGRLLPSEELLRLSKELAPKKYYTDAEGHILLTSLSLDEDSLPPKGLITRDYLESLGYEEVLTAISPHIISSLSDIFSLNREFIHFDFKLVTQQGKSQSIKDPHTKVYAKDNLFVEEGANIKAAIINAENGPVYIGKQAEVQEGAMIRGNHIIGMHARVNMGTRLRGDTSIGPYAKVGGEVTNSVIHSYSNKSHEGYLGNSVMGSFCNLGADTNVSNLKNTYGSVKQWSYRSGRLEHTGKTFCGAVMGDHTKTGINTMLNTGTVIGYSGNVFGAGYPDKFIPSFSWGGAEGFTTYELEKAMEVATTVKSRRNLPLNYAEQRMMEEIYTRTAAYRHWEREKV